MCTTNCCFPSTVSCEKLDFLCSHTLPALLHKGSWQEVITAHHQIYLQQGVSKDKNGSLIRFFCECNSCNFFFSKKQAWPPNLGALCQMAACLHGLILPLALQHLFADSTLQQWSVTRACAWKSKHKRLGITIAAPPAHLGLRHSDLLAV